MRRGRGAASAASPRPWTPAATASSPSPRPPRRSGPSPTSGASGGTCRGGAGGHLRPLLVRPGAGGAGGGLLLRGRLDAGLRGDQRLRGPARPERQRSSLKFWLAISQEEQLRRFEERQATPFKRFKITEEDWRNREKWDAYEAAICDMLDRTSTEIAPWTLVESEDKHFGRIKILQDPRAAAGGGAVGGIRSESGGWKVAAVPRCYGGGSLETASQGRYKETGDP